MSSKLNTKNKVMLCIYSKTKNPEQISDLLGEKYDEKTNLGHKISPLIIAKENRWALVEKDNNLDVEDQLDLLVVRLKKIQTTLVESISNNKTDYRIQVEYVIESNEAPQLFFTEEQIAFLAKIKTSLWIDQYIFPEEDNE